MALGAIVLGAALGYASIKFKVEGDPLVEKIEAILPQTQCGQCGYPGCKPYAAAISAGEADINLCPPGGMDGVRKLADLLGREVKPLDAEEKPKQVAIIDEETCIGCTLCIQACPVDAIVGAAKQMHTIIDPCAPVASCASNRARSSASHAADHRESRQLEMEISGDRNKARQTSQTRRLKLSRRAMLQHSSASRAASNRRPTRRLRCRSRSARRRCRSRLYVPLHQSIGGVAESARSKSASGYSRGN
jgi:electron transport complex protein RnfB